MVKIIYRDGDGCKVEFKGMKFLVFHRYKEDEDNGKLVHKWYVDPEGPAVDNNYDGGYSSIDDAIKAIESGVHTYEPSPEEVQALLWVREGLASGKLKHVNSDDVEGFTGGVNGNNFNMGVGGVKGNCGTVGCIGGWMWIKLHEKVVNTSRGYYAPTDSQVWSMQNYVGDNRALYHLFYPNCGNFEDITEEQAIRAIDNYLETGDPQWVKVVEES